MPKKSELRCNGHKESRRRLQDASPPSSADTKSSASKKKRAAKRGVKPPSMKPTSADKCLMHHRDLDLLRKAAKADDFDRVVVAIRVILGLQERPEDDAVSSRAPYVCNDEALEHARLIREDICDDNLFPAMIRIMNVRDAADGTVVLHAAASHGSTTVLRNTLCLTIVCQVLRRPLKWRRRVMAEIPPQSLNDWLLNTVGCKDSGLDKDDCDRIADFSPEHVHAKAIRYVVFEQEFSLAEIISIARRQTGFSVPQDIFSKGTSSAPIAAAPRRKPQLRVEDAKTIAMDPSFREGVAKGLEQSCDLSQVKGELESVPNQSVVYEEISFSSSPSEDSTSYAEEGEFICPAPSVVSADDEFDDNDSLVSTEDDDFSDGEIVSFDVDGMSGWDVEDDESWHHVMDDVASVLSVHSEMLVRSYLDAAMNPPVVTIPKWSHSGKDIVVFPSRPTAKKLEELIVSSDDLSVTLPDLGTPAKDQGEDEYWYEGDMYDDEFFWRGAKEGRGGKLETMFKGNPKKTAKKLPAESQRLTRKSRGRRRPKIRA